MPSVAPPRFREPTPRARSDVDRETRARERDDENYVRRDARAVEGETRARERWDAFERARGVRTGDGGGGDDAGRGVRARDDRERGDGDGGAGDDLDRWIARRVGGRRRRASDGRDLWVVETRADGDADVSRGTKRGDGREDAGRWRVAG